MQCFALALLASVLCGGCAAAPPAPPPPVREVALLPVWNPPGRSAVIGVFTFDAWIRSTRDAVGDQLAVALRARLTALGLDVTAASTPGGYAPVALRDAVAIAAAARSQTPALDEPGPPRPLLYVRVLKWEADHVTRPERVDVLVEAALLQSGSGKVLWSARGPEGPVVTRGATSLGEGYRRAADAVADWLVGRWRTVR